MIKSTYARMRPYARRFGLWSDPVEVWQVFFWLSAACMALAFLITVAAPPLLVLAIPAALALFIWAWAREFSLLMRLEDGAFPGHNDKLIWAILLIVLPPAGLFLFRSYRAEHWPEPKPDAPADDLS